MSDEYYMGITGQSGFEGEYIILKYNTMTNTLTCVGSKVKHDSRPWAIKDIVNPHYMNNYKHLDMLSPIEVGTVLENINDNDLDCIALSVPILKDMLNCLLKIEVSNEIKEVIDGN